MTSRSAYTAVYGAVARVLSEESPSYGSGWVTGAEAVEILEDLAVEDAEDRVIWRNISALTLNDVAHLAELEFYAVDCGHCSARIRRARVHVHGRIAFQGARNDGGIGELCEECAGLYLKLKELADD